MSEVADDPKFEYLRRAAAAGHVEYDRAAAAACLDAIRGRACEYDEEAEPEACAGVFRGLIGRNGPCMDAAECAGEAVCGFDPGCPRDSCCVGACRVLPSPLEVGAGCSFGGVRCVADAYCGSDPMTGQATVCTAVAKVGGVCAEDRGCVEEARCEGSRCVALLDPGESCEGMRDEACAGDGVCRSRNDESVVCVVEAELGAPCYEDIGCARFDSYCDEGSRLCTLLPGPGQACASGRCLPYAYCREGEQGETCMPRAEEGEACGIVKVGGAAGREFYVTCVESLECVDDVCEPTMSSVTPAMRCPVPEVGR